MWSDFVNAENCKWLIAIAVIPSLLAYCGNSFQKEQTERSTITQREETRRSQIAHDAATERLKVENDNRLFTELLSKREEADVGVRREVFSKVLETYLTPDQKEVEQRLVALELLALNFHESLNLRPLFSQLDKEIELQPRHLKFRLRPMLLRIAQRVKLRQLEMLNASGDKFDRTIILGELTATPVPTPCAKLDFKIDTPASRCFQFEVVEHDRALKIFLIRVTYERVTHVFWVDIFDFPLTDFWRISKTERFSVALSSHDQNTAQFQLVYFPSSRGSPRDRPYIDEALSSLTRIR